MDLNTITMPVADARAAFLDYRRAVRARHSKEDEEIMRGYKALAKGLRVINLREVLVAGGEDAQHRPKLAVCRADAPRCFMRRYGSGELRLGATENAVGGWGRTVKSLRLEYPAGTLPSVDGWKTWDHVEGVAIVPNIPPALRPLHDLSGYHVLFEAEWKPVAPRDPALLKHLGGELWAVLAVWDLTDLERAVLAARGNPS